MSTSTLKILRELNDYTQEFVAEDILNISQTTYARLEQSPSKITAEQAQKLADLYKVSIANLLSEATPVITFKERSIFGKATANGFVQNQSIRSDDNAIEILRLENEFLIKQNTELLELIKTLGGQLVSKVKE